MARLRECGLETRASVQGLRPYLTRAKHSRRAGQQPIDIVMAEPYYRSCEGLLPWATLRCVALGLHRLPSASYPFLRSQMRGTSPQVVGVAAPCCV